MGRPPTKYDYDKAFDVYCAHSDQYGKPLDNAQLEKLTGIPRRLLYSYGKTHDWLAAREKRLLLEGGFGKPAEAPPPVPPEVQKVQDMPLFVGADGVCPGCGHKIIVQQGSVTALAMQMESMQIILANMIERFREDGLVKTSEARDVVGILEKLNSLLQRARQMQEADRNRTGGSMLAGADLDEAKRLKAIYLEMEAQMPPDPPTVEGIRTYGDGQ